MSSVLSNCPSIEDADKDTQVVQAPRRSSDATFEGAQGASLSRELQDEGRNAWRADQVWTGAPKRRVRYYDFLSNTYCCNAMNTSKDNRPYYVYALVDPRDNVVFYVGEGKAYRPEQHLIEAALMTNEGKKVNKIREIWNSGNDVKIIRLAKDFITQQHALEIESLFLIEAREGKTILGLKCDLTNTREGDYERSFRRWNHPETIPGFDYRKRAIESAETYDNCKPLYAHIIAKIPEFRNAISITDQHIRTQPRPNGFEFVLKPKQGKFVHFEYIARGETEEQIRHAEVIRDILGEKKSFTYAKVERAAPGLEVHQFEQVECELRKFIQDVYSAERRIQERATR